MDAGEETLPNPTANGKSKGRSAAFNFGTGNNPIDEKFKFDLDTLIRFLFPTSLQHPLVAGRLICFGLYGPLDEHGQLRSGPKGGHVLAEYELQQMCLQIEKEDVVQVYLHRKRDMGMLTTMEQELMISQADAKLKQEKGKAMLPRLTKQDVYDMFKRLPRDELGRISFHEAQQMIDQWRAHRVKENKLVYPSILSSHEESEGNRTERLPTITSGSRSGSGGGGGGNASVVSGETGQETMSYASASRTIPIRREAGPTRRGKVSESVAPRTMFLKMKGHTNPDIIEHTTKALSKHAFKITSVDSRQSAEITSNVKLLREIPPYCPNPYTDRQKWNDNSTMTGTGLGSLVKSTNSSTTWKRKVTLY